MAEQLQENGNPIEVGPVTIRTPGLTGVVEVYEPLAGGTRSAMRGAEDAKDALIGALRSTRTIEQLTVEFSETREQEMAQDNARRDRHGEASIEVTVPSPGDNYGQFILAADENGVVSWHLPVQDDNSVDATRGGATRTYVIQRRVETQEISAAEAGSRGIIGAIGKKVLKVIVFPLIDPLIGAVGDFFARKWEARNRPYGIRTFTPGNYTRPAGEAIVDEGWDGLSAGKSLLFVHGTFSRSYSAFSGLDLQTMEELYDRYQGRVFAFEHPTLSDDPRENVAWLLNHIPDSAKINCDIICHSRGGLVSRELARANSPKINIDRIVFVAVPNAGTILTNAKHMGDFIDSYTNLLQAFPDNAVTDTLEAIITVVKQLAVGALGGLGGVQSMLPDGPYLKDLTTAIPANPNYYALASNFTPAAGSPVSIRILNRVVDKAFENAKNDLVVPTDGCYEFGAGGLIPAARLHLFDAATDEPPVHTRFFGKEATRKSILNWLS
ncbi:MAG: esterase/lipase family protein [Thermoanaerobaculia bacterium]